MDRWMNFIFHLCPSSSSSSLTSVCRHRKFMAPGQGKKPQKKSAEKVEAAGGAEPSAEPGHPLWLLSVPYFDFFFVASSFPRLPARPLSKEIGIKIFTPADN